MSSIVTRPAVPPYSSSDDRDVDLLQAEVVQQVAQRLGLGDEDGRADRPTDVELLRRLAEVLEQVAGVQHADDVVERAVVDRDAGVAGLLERLLHLVERGRGLEARRSPGGRS